MKTYILDCYQSNTSKEQMHFSVNHPNAIGSEVFIEWFCVYADGSHERQPIDLEAWNLKAKDVPQNENGFYSVRNARWIWDRLVQNNGCKVAQSS